jgi:hypothetical protein
VQITEKLFKGWSQIQFVKAKFLRFMKVDSARERMHSPDLSVLAMPFLEITGPGSEQTICISRSRCQHITMI